MIPPDKVGSESDGTDGDNVFCNVYDILPRVNALARCLGSQWGIYHTGVQVHGLEVSFGGTDDNCTGVFCAQPRSAQGARFRRQVPIGRVDLDPFELRQRVADISEAWPGRAYDPFERNCNHFSDCFCSELTGQGAPPYVNRFTKSRVIRCVFFRCLVPLGRCVERFHKVEPITYTQDASCGAEVAELYGVRGINQVLVEAATVQKARANDLFRSGAFVEARDAYEKALGYLTRLQTQNLVRGQALRCCSHLCHCTFRQRPWTVSHLTELNTSELSSPNKSDRNVRSAWVLRHRHWCDLHTLSLTVVCTLRVSRCFCEIEINFFVFN